MVRGIRGAITVEADTPEQILTATRTLLEAILERNRIQDPAELAALIFTVTEDLVSAFPAEAARQLGMNRVPLLSAREVPVPGSLPRVIRILALWNTDAPPEAIRHVYLGEAQRLRPDLDSAF
ncbi:MAG TPA: chorismate mutase [Oceanithermus profundus]|uniref:chorismate mutase n=1 Tax=Oceanithermus profundus TaxID=187137 RepID=A0A7C4V5S3_9DEIN|nr:chorismate mutase [Oceanithermus profundus]